jgi:hypothetical protein
MYGEISTIELGNLVIPKETFKGKKPKQEIPPLLFSLLLYASTNLVK